ncbi:prolipoprotein diacylglyceryl transferase [Thiohalomonas denitrificans]|uniref:prolipoprotein diacylglyceryl transferase n=1 Tax=Thiohalomonas denitrificans TaxID=415747 RepID=UPI0026E9DD0A|nr:prolipoprotein diacylglyceryl transferase [Thiohalomonas denitrificans]
MLRFPDIDPVAISFGPVQVHWYGLMYLVGFVGGWWLGRRRAAQPRWNWKPAQVDDLVFYSALGVVLGGRIGYVLFYNWGAFLQDPLMLFRIWEGGMSFHGGLLGVMVALGVYAWRENRRYFEVVDFLAPLVPIGLGAGRIGNFINGELWGKPTDLPWGMVFPGAGDVARHPSQLYQFFLEGVVLFAILWWFSSRPRPTMAVSGVFAVGYGLFRFLVEFVREPDAHLGYLAFGWVTMGQVLSLPLIVVGLVLLGLAYGRGNTGKAVSNGQK